MNDSERQQYYDLVSEKLNTHDYANLLETYGIDEERLMQEWFAEDFRAIVAQVAYVESVRSKMGNSQVDPEKLQEYFSTLFEF
jgi:diphthamide synthase (EF-2-diphthine--ammonia ligase)